MSPFAEKIRLMLGAKAIAWRSVIIPQIMPKPDLIALTGGYRKTPVLQIGADIYCDTARIAQELDRIAPEPPLYPDAHAASAQRLARWSDTELFQIAVALVFQPAFITQLFPGGADELQAFIADRMAMRQGATVRRTPPDEAKGALETFLIELDTQLSDGRAYLLGSAPTIADFSAYHPLWFVRRIEALAAELSRFAHVTRWLERVAKLGHGKSADLPSAAAVDLAKTASPADLSPQSDHPELSPGTKVEVGATDYGLEATPGELLRCTRDEIVVLRTDPRAGDVAVHFPRLGYQIRAADDPTRQLR
jgi:glutathione S-transferase